MARRQVVVEEVVFESYEEAVDVKERAEIQIEKIDGCKILALIGTICGAVSLLFMYAEFSSVAMMAAIVISCVCYAKAKCFGGAFKWGLSWAKWGWFLIPYFPIDLVIGACGLFVGAFVFFFFPSLGLRGVRKQAEKDLDDANMFISNYQMQTQAN